MRYGYHHRCTILSQGDFIKRFYLDDAFGMDDTQTAVYSTIGRPLVIHVLGGYNASLIAYGQTGTGKTYTMGK